MNNQNKLKILKRSKKGGRRRESGEWRPKKGDRRMEKLQSRIAPQSIKSWRMNTNNIKALSNSGSVIARSAALTIFKRQSIARQSNPKLRSTLPKTCSGLCYNFYESFHISLWVDTSKPRSGLTWIAPYEMWGSNDGRSIRTLIRVQRIIYKPKILFDRLNPIQGSWLLVVHSSMGCTYGYWRSILSGLSIIFYHLNHGVV